MRLSRSLNWDNSLRHRIESDPGNICLTPEWLVARVRDEVFGGVIDLDPATEPDNPTGAERFITQVEDGILTPWRGPNVYCNPPYGSTAGKWVEKSIFAHADGNKVVLLLPARTETKWFQRALLCCDDALLFSKRLQFGRFGAFGGVKAANAPFPSVLFGFGIRLKAIDDLGTIVRPA
jgi:hypothetical protein